MHNYGGFRMKRKITALLAAGILSAACFTGCGENKSTTTIKGNLEPAVTLAPGVEYTAEKGSEYVYEDLGLKVTFSELALTSDVPDGKGRYTYAMVFSALNEGKTTVDVRMLDDFAVSVDGKECDHSIFTALSAANGILAYPGSQRYDAQLEPGASCTGFVPFSLDTLDWKEITVKYSPDRSQTNDTIVYTVGRSELVEKIQ